MAHNVKCTVCGQVFDRDKIQAVKSGARRYAHHRCMPEGELVPMPNPIDEDLVALEQYIKELLGENNYSIAKVRKQIKEYKENYDYSYSGMLKTLKWFYDIKGNPKEKARAAGGIGIIPFVYKDALNYYYNLYLAQMTNEAHTFKQKIKYCEIEAPEAKRRPPKLFNIGEDE